ncbi:hypothetical protein DSH74_13265 [Enterococcus faecium]|nr:hypothetical protein [Enterococcus faecium]EGP5696962.1 hypothetical protein [Enterococcus faecium]
MKIKELSAKELLDLIQGRKISLSKAYSLWEEIFDKYLEVELDEIQTDMQLIREGRNTVGHNKELNVSLCLVLLKKLKKYIKHLDNAFQKILIGDIGNEELDIMADDLNGYINYKLDATKLNTMKQTLGSMESVMSRLQEMNTSGLGNLISRIQEMNTDGFGSAVSRIQEMNTDGFGSAVSRIQEMNTSGLVSAVSRIQEMNTSGLVSAVSRIQEMNTSGLVSAVSRIQEMNTSRLGSVISKLQELNTSSTIQNLSNLDDIIPYQEEIADNIDDEEERDLD